MQEHILIKSKRLGGFDIRCHIIKDVALGKLKKKGRSYIGSSHTELIKPLQIYGWNINSQLS